MVLEVANADEKIKHGPATLNEAFLQAEEQLERAVWRILTVWKLGEESAVKKMTKKLYFI